MSQTSEIFGDFAEALINPGGPVPHGVYAVLAPDIESRFDVYRNNVFASLIDALQDTFPVIRKLVGGDFFRALAREFIIASPPSSPVLFEYGNGFAAFITGFAPLQEMSWLADMAVLEMAWLKAYHAAEAVPLGADDFSNISSARFASLRFNLHPSLQLVTSKWPVLRIWQANQDGAEPCEIDIESGGEAVLILRVDEEVELHRLADGADVFIRALHKGQTLEQANGAASQGAAFDLSANLAVLIAGGAFIRFQL